MGTEDTTSGDAAGCSERTRAAAGFRARGVPVLLSAVAGHAVSGGYDGRRGGLLLRPFPRGFGVEGQKRGGGERGEGEAEGGSREEFGCARRSLGGAGTSASLVGAGEQEEEEKEEEEEADASDLLPPLSSSTTAVARSRLVFLCFSSRCVLRCRWQARDARHQGCFGPEEQLRAFS